MDYEQILERMQDKYRELTGFSADDASDIGIRLKVLAGEAESLYSQMSGLRSQIFAQTATDESLDLHAETRGIVRKPAIAAAGILRFTREVPSSFDIPLPRGILCSTRSDPQIHFETIEDAVLEAGETEADVPAAAVDAGVSGNVLGSKICLMITGAPGITAVSNPDAFTGGADAESDHMLRTRLLSSFENISNSTNRAFYFDAAMSHDDVVSANILPRARGRGTVDVVIACHSPEQEAGAAQDLREHLEVEKEINVDVKVYPAVRDEVDVKVEIDVEPGVHFGQAVDDCTATIRNYLSVLEVGRPLMLSRLGRELLNVEGVRNYRILRPENDISPAQSHVIRPGDIELERMAPI